MEPRGKLKCFECNGEYVPKDVTLNGIKTEGLVCNKCKDTVFSQAQSKKYVGLFSLREATEAERKIIKIGGSMGITLPDMLKKFGVKVGRKVKLEDIDRKSIKITLI